jgi:DNA-binding transcriptional MerR regulator
MSLTARELQQIKGIGEVLSVRLLEAGHDSFAKIVRLGESGLKEIKGINLKAIPDIIAQAARLSEKKPGTRDEQVAVLKESLQGLRQAVQELTRAARDRFSEKLAGRTGKKLTGSLVRFIDAVEKLEDKAGKKVKRSGKAVMKAEQQLEGLAETGLKELRKGLKRARKALQRVDA